MKWPICKVVNEHAGFQTAKLKKVTKKKPFVISSQSRQGVKEVLRELWKVIAAARQGAEDKPHDQVWQP